jgi:alpha-amylase
MISKAHWQGGLACLPLALLVCCVLSCSIALNAATTDWWNDAVFYEIFVRSFQDSDGDGIGDLRGLIERLDYLNDGDSETHDDLGITALWLMPICKSPSYHGYDVTDYYAIEPDYGTSDDFRLLLDEAHARGIHVIIDLVLNHTSSSHPWFQSSRESSSAYRDWYIWSDGLPGYVGPWGQRVWHFGEVAFYYGLFWSEMPDLNYNNPKVTLQMLDIVRFWLDEVGVDGFRLDAIRHLIEDGEQQLNTTATHSWLYGFRTVAKDWNSKAFLLGEVWDSPEEVVPYLDDQLDMCFEFELADAILNGVLNSRVSGIENALREILSIYPAGQYASFLSNHDQERVMTRLFNNEDKAKLAASILLTLPGVPFIYYGEEIGMTGAKPDELIRTPMQWSDAEAGGFTTGTPWELLSEDRLGRNVAVQTDTADSLLSTYRALIQLRTENLVLRGGDLILVDTGHPSILSYLRMKDEALTWVLHNLSAFGARPSKAISETQTPLDTNSMYFAVDLLEGVDSFSFGVTSGSNLAGTIPALAPYQTVILELRPL